MKKKSTYNWLRVLALLVLLVIIAAIAIVALDGGYEEYDHGQEGGHLAESPEYAYEYNESTPEYPQGDNYAVSIEMDFDGNISMYPSDLNYNVALDGDYVFIQLPAELGAVNVRVTLPYSWAYEVNHDIETRSDEYGESSATYLRTYTTIRITHTWNSSSREGFIGIMPLSVTGLPGGLGFTQENLPANASLQQWNDALGTTGNRVVSVQGNQPNMPGTFTIVAGRHVIITSSGTNLNGSLTNHTREGTPFTITRTTAGRHFVVRDGATLTLSHIILDGGVTSTDPGFNRGGVHVGGTPASPRIGGATLVLLQGASIRRNAWSNNAAIPGTFVGTVHNTGTGVGAGVEAAGGLEPGYANGGARVIMHEGSEVVDNITTTNWGGGIHVRQGGHLVMHGGQVARNRTFRTASPSATANGSTAGVHVGAAETFRSSFIMHDGAVRDNTAYATRGGDAGIFRAGGAGVFIHQFCEFRMYGGYIESNQLSGNRLPGSTGDFVLNGAGVLLVGRSAEGTPIENATRFYLDGGTIRNNTVSMTATGVDGVLGGGGVGLYGGVFTMISGHIEYNTADEGGGVYINTGGGGGSVIMQGGYIRHNRANFGAGVGVNPQVAMPQGIWGHTSFTMHNGEISHNRYNPDDGLPQGGGGVFVYGGVAHTDENHARRNPGTFTMHGGVIEHNRAVTGGGIYLGGGLDGANALYFGGHGAEFVLDDGSIVRENTATHGGGIYGSSSPTYGDGDYIGGAARLTLLAGGLIENNTATNGGGVNMNSSAFLMEGGIIQDNNATNGGGVMLTNGATFEMTGGVIRDHNATHGGGVYLIGSHTLFTMSEGYIRDNLAVTGGGVAVFGNDDYPTTFIMDDDMDGGNIYNNISTSGGSGSGLNISGGGGVFVTGENGRFYMHDGTITDNVARRWSGGGVKVTGQARFTMYSGLIARNDAAPNYTADGNSGGGGVAARNDGLFTMYGGTISHNHSVLGSGVLSYNQGMFVMEGGHIYGNTVAGLGGGGVGVIAGGNADLRGGVISDHNLPGNHDGGGVWVGHIRGLITGENPMHMRDYSSLIVSGVEIRNNQARNGGGIFVEGGPTPLPGMSEPLESSWLDNVIHGDESSGAINVAPFMTFDRNSLVMTDGHIHGNTARQNGGGIHAADEAFLVMTGGIVGGHRPAELPAASPNPHANTAVNGGGVWVGGRASFEMSLGGDAEDPTYGSIIGNISTQTGIHDPGGGGVLTTGVGTTFNMSAGVIEANIAINGGGVSVIGASVFTMLAGPNQSHGIIRGNRAGYGGGGVYVNNPGSRFLLQEGVIGGNANYNEGNHAAHGGGAIAGSSGQIEMSGGHILGNTATENGGGICLEYGRGVLIMTGGTIGGERPEGIPDSAANPYRNHAPIGGGIIVASGSTFYMDGGRIIGNTATDGAGVWVSLVSSGRTPLFQLRGLGLKEISDNRATRNGGGVFISNTGQMRMAAGANNLHITNNRAGTDGGGIFTVNNQYTDPITRIPPGVAPLFFAYSNMTLNGVTFGGNTASRLFWPPDNATAVIPTSAFVALSTSQSPLIPDARRHPLNNYDINFRVDLQTFDFLKTDYQIYHQNPIISLLEGGQFRLFRNIDPGAGLGTSSAYLVNVNNPESRWEEVIFTGGPFITEGGLHAESTTEAIPIRFVMDPRHTYQLVEVMAPVNFQIPMGQWRITYDMIGNTFREPAIIGGVSAPGFIRSTDGHLSSVTPPIAARSNLFYLGNMAQLELPMAGGTGRDMFVMAGMSILGACAVLMVAMYIMKKRVKWTQN
ncbi:MAG: hypothetical protein FWE11_02070 [Defluviitaleaceae bacterium]|nr:hypothetical protein [Defluviitaleaceae bacterium]